jgi:uncharacterized Fe-S cluster-containing protein
VNSKDALHPWLPPGKNCGLCGEKNCEDFLHAVGKLTKSYPDCPFYHDQDNQDSGPQATAELEAIYPEKDLLGHNYDFVLEPLPGEVSARKIVLPFRADMVEKMRIKEGDYVLGRPMGAGCPIPHVLRVIRAEQVTGLLYTWVVGPRYSRDREVKDVVAYHMIGFEGLAGRIKKEPSFGCRVTFLPGFCMMSLNHTGLVNMLLQKREGLHLRIEDIHLLAGLD